MLTHLTSSDDQQPSNVDPAGLPASGSTDWKKKAEVALHYRCDVRTITNFMNHGVLPFVKIGRFVRFDLVACDEAMRQYERRKQVA